MSITVTDVPDKGRWEAREGDILAGLAAYRRSDDLVIFTHTIVEDDYAGQGVGGSLARAALDAARERGLRVRPDCPVHRRVDLQAPGIRGSRRGTRPPQRD